LYIEIMDPYYSYIIYSQTRDRYYVGSSSNPEQRLERHNQGATPSTRSGRPWKLMYVEQYASKTEALKREKDIKRRKSRKYIEDLISHTHLDNS